MSQTPEYPFSSTPEPTRAVVISDPDPVLDPSYDLPPTYGQPESSAADVAKDQAAAVGGTAADAGKHVAGTAKDEASNVAAETAQQAKNLIGQATTELQDQAVTQQQRLASGIRALGGELSSMADGSEKSGVATDLVRQVSQRADDIASWLDDRDPGGLLEDVRSFARRRPGAFLAIAAGAGLLAGRLTRGTVDANRDTSGSGAQGGSPSASTTPAVGYPDPAVSQALRTFSVQDPAPVYSDTFAAPAPAYADPVIDDLNQSGGRP